MMGHSTGCQNVLTILRNHSSLLPSSRPHGIIAQAPVSDRQVPFDDDGRMASLAEKARKLREEGKGEEMMGKEESKMMGVGKCSVYRCWSLMCKGGDDDLFSTDLVSSL